jgi:hypothetical protein
MSEIFPSCYGVLVGVFCGFLPSRRWRYGCWLASSTLFGVAATVVTGEWKVSWGFLLADIPLVAIGGLAMLLVLAPIRRRGASVLGRNLCSSLLISTKLKLQR